MKRVTIDGNMAAANIAYLVNDGAFIYPITPSSTMSEYCDVWKNEGIKNIFGNDFSITEMQSEAGVAGAMHGALSAGSLTTTFTSSQGLLLMIPNMYKIAGEQMPNVINVAARSIATHALNIFCDHSDIYACLKTGYNFISCTSVQEVNDLTMAANIASLNTSLPFVVFFDGFRTSHELNTINQFTREEIASILPFEKIDKFKSRCLNSSSPICKGTAQNPDSFFQNRMAGKKAYENVINEVQNAFKQVGRIAKTNYNTIDYYGPKDAQNIIVVMGSAACTCQLTSEFLNLKNEKTGLIIVRLLAPFDSSGFLKVLPKTAKNITVMERNADFVSDDTLFTFVNSCVKNINLFKVIYGLGGKEFTPDMAIAVYENMKNNGLKSASVGIIDDVNKNSLTVRKIYKPHNEYCIRIYGLGSDGSVSASKSLTKILSSITNKYSQSYFEYDSKKSGSMTTSHIRLDDKPIISSFNSEDVDFLICNNTTFINKYGFANVIENNGMMLINAPQNYALSEKLVKQLKQKNIQLYSLEANKIAKENGLNNKINNIMLAGFFYINKLFDSNLTIKQLKESIETTLSCKGEVVVKNNINAIDCVKNEIKQIDLDKVSIAPNTLKNKHGAFYDEVMYKIASLEGNKVPVSAFNADGSMPTDTAKFEKRGIASMLPCWHSEKCIQCNKCIMACPHAAIRAKLVDSATQLPENMKNAKAFGTNGNFIVQISPLDCTGCGLCAEACPVKDKAITMIPYDESAKTEIDNFEIFEKLPKNNPFGKNSVKGIGFEKPYFEFSGACAGCGETPYIKLVTQLFGDRMIIANATGCSSIYGATYPSCPYAKDSEGFGPSWANSLFEDNAEYGLGIAMAKENERNNYIHRLKSFNQKSVLKDIIEKFLKNTEDNDVAKECILKLKSIKNVDEKEKWIISGCHLMQKSSIWIIGGDGWAYDIGFGGLDHVFASGKNVNILVLDTEVYSNTGGQTSKATPRGSVAKFSAGGKTTMKKDLPSMALTYGDVYVATVSLGADNNQLVKAFNEAAAYDGVSIIFAYSPCINQGLDMTKSQIHQKLAVESGYWTLFRYNPSSEQRMTIDSAEPSIEMEDFLLKENRYATLHRNNPELAKTLFAEAKIDAQNRRKNYFSKILKKDE